MPRYTEMPKKDMKAQRWFSVFLTRSGFGIR